MNISDILIHINQSLDVNQQQTLEASVREVAGVIAPRFAPDKVHLFSVAFNPAVTNSQVLLKQVQSFGYDAQLVGI